MSRLGVAALRLAAYVLWFTFGFVHQLHVVLLLCSASHFQPHAKQFLRTRAALPFRLAPLWSIPQVVTVDDSR